MEATSCHILSCSDKDSITGAIIAILHKNGITWTDQSQVTSGRRQLDTNGTSPVFGLSLESTEQERKLTESDGRPCYLPKFFVESIEVLKGVVQTEGLFRKAGSLNRQKGLRLIIEDGHSLPLSSNPHDVASLLKQYLRELTEPLLTKRLTPLLLECTKLFTDNDDEQKENKDPSLTRTQAILMSTLLLPTQHLLCLKILMQLLSLVVSHRSESLMDSRGLAVVIGPNIVSFEKDNKKLKGTTFDKVNNITCIVSTLIDNAHSIGQVPLIVQKLSQEQQKENIELNKKRKKHKRHETVSLLLKGTINKIRGGKKTTPQGSPTVSDDVMNSDGLGPSACKRVAFEESSDFSDKSTCSLSPSTNNSSSIRKRLFKGKNKKHYSTVHVLRKGIKMCEEVPLLNSQQHFQEDLFPNIPSSPLLQTTLPSPLCTVPSSPVPMTLPNTVPLVSSNVPLVCSSVPPLPSPVPSSTVHSVSSNIAPMSSTVPSVSSTVLLPSPIVTTNMSSNYKLVSKTRKTYATSRTPRTYSTSRARPTSTSRTRGPLKADHNIVKKPDTTPSVSQSDYGITASTPVRPVVRSTEPLNTDTVVGNNESYLHAVGRLDTPSFSSLSSQRRKRRSASMKATTPHSNNRSERRVVNSYRSHSIRDGISTARSPWISAKDSNIQVSEWII